MITVRRRTADEEEVADACAGSDLTGWGFETLCPSLTRSSPSTPPTPRTHQSPPSRRYNVVGTKAEAPFFFFLLPDFH